MMAYSSRWHFARTHLLMLHRTSRRSHTSPAPVALAVQPPELDDSLLLAARFPGIRGRGLVAKRDITEGERVLCERLFVGAPRTMRTHGEVREELLLAPALQQWRPAMELDAQLHEAQRQFPRLVLRIAERILIDFVSDPEAGAASTWGRLRELCRANISSIPLEWQQDFQAIRAAMCVRASSSVSAPASAPVSVTKGERLIPCSPHLFDVLFSEEWLAQIMGVLHLNTFRLPSPHASSNTDSPTTISGIFLAASLINHSCVPNLTICWKDGRPRGNESEESERLGPVCFVAARDIASGEECTSEP